MKISFEKNEEKGTIKVITPYNAGFVQKCRNLRGSFKDGAWYFDDSIEEYVKKALIDTYGVDGTSPVELCTLVVNKFTSSSSCGAVDLFGRTVAIAFGRDSGAKLGDGIILINGSVDSSGSVKNWSTEVRKATFEIQKFPLERTKFDDIQKAIAEGWVEVKIPKKAKPQSQILEEIKFHEDKLAELKALLTPSV